MRKLFVGSLSWGTDDEALRQAFEAYGPVEYVKVITDRETGRSRGFGFVSFENDQDADKALEGMDGAELDGRRLNVDVAQDKPRNAPRGPGNSYDSPRPPREERAPRVDAAPRRAAYDTQGGPPSYVPQDGPPLDSPSGGRHGKGPRRRRRDEGGGDSW